MMREAVPAVRRDGGTRHHGLVGVYIRYSPCPAQAVLMAVPELPSRPFTLGCKTGIAFTLAFTFAAAGPLYPLIARRFVESFHFARLPHFISQFLLPGP